VKKTFAHSLALWSLSLVCAGCGKSPSTDIVPQELKKEGAEFVSEENLLTPGTEIVFANLSGPTIDWGPGPEKRIYAKNSFHNQKAPTLFVENWIGEAPNTQGKFVLIDFWATWCPPCRKAIPELNELAVNFPDQLVVIGITNESLESIRKMTEPVMNYYSAIDTQGRTSTEIGIEGIPHVLLIDPSGTVCWQGYPSDEEDGLKSSTLQRVIDRYQSGM
jgi:cytochrome c biogenesis protein CcmG, thiol:disulfide interchange protein DsbE